MANVSISGLVHVQDEGDRPLKGGEFAGNRGKSRRVEGFMIKIDPPVAGLGIRYKAHLAGIGDTAWVNGGQYVGTKGQARAVEGIQIELTGAEASKYDVVYMTHVQDHGDSVIYKNGAYCGTKGESRRVEGLWVKIVPRGAKFRVVLKTLHCTKTESIHSADKVYGLLASTVQSDAQRSERFDLNDGQTKDVRTIFNAAGLTLGIHDGVSVAFFDDDGDWAGLSTVLGAIGGAVAGLAVGVAIASTTGFVPAAKFCTELGLAVGEALAAAGNEDDLLFRHEISTADVSYPSRTIPQVHGSSWNSSESKYELTYQVVIP